MWRCSVVRWNRTRRRESPIAALSKIGIGHDDDGVFAAHLAGDFGAALRRFDVERAADFVGAGERYGAQLRRVDHRFADHRAGADEHVEHAGRQAGFFDKFR